MPDCLRSVVLAAFCIALAACGHWQQPRPADDTMPGLAAVTVDQADERQWWRVCFRMPLDDQARPRWAIDLLLADQVVAPLISAHAGDIAIWRFHRRAAADAAGHQFSVWLFSGAETQAAIAARLQGDALLARLQEQSLLDAVIIDCGAPDDSERLAATSDNAWDERLQKSWPYFMMGASLHWVALSREIQAGMPRPDDSAGALLAHYREVDEEMARLWQSQGGHAYLHHLSALFGYRSLLIRF